MQHISNAFLHQIEIFQADRWDHGPLELVYLQEAQLGGHEKRLAIHDWNMTQRAGFLRSAETMAALASIVPHLEARKNPNMILVPTRGCTTSLDLMLASLLPDSALERHGLRRVRPNMTLLHVFADLPGDYGARARAAFAEHIWSRIAPRARLSPQAFAPDSPLRLLAGDTRLWAHRLYRLALERRDAYFSEPVVEDGEDEWTPMEELRAQFLATVQEEDRHLFTISRPTYGGDVWDVDDPDERESVLAAAIEGEGVMDSLEPILAVLHGSRLHEDFSAQHSWIKEDFERAFYKKRARLKVDLIETIDDAPAYDLEPSQPYERVLFRDVIATLDRRERRLLIALRMGRTASSIAREDGLRGHASVSRRIAALKKKVRAALEEDD